MVHWVSFHGDACPRGQSLELVTALISECGPRRDSYCSWVFRFLRCHVISCDEGVQIAQFVFDEPSDFDIWEIVPSGAFPDCKRLF